MAAVGLKQEYETTMIKGLITNFRRSRKDASEDPEFAAQLEILKKMMIAKQQKLDAAARALLVP